jgi:hypothetical protein
VDFLWPQSVYVVQADIVCWKEQWRREGVLGRGEEVHIAVCLLWGSSCLQPSSSSRVPEAENRRLVAN